MAGGGGSRERGGPANSREKYREKLFFRAKKPFKVSNAPFHGLLMRLAKKQ
jgi:hypothetical protein